MDLELRRLSVPLCISAGMQFYMTETGLNHWQSIDNVED